MPTQGTYFIDTSSFATATNIYTDSGLTTVASNGWYQSGVSFRQLSGGTLGSSVYTCECTTFSSSTIQSTSAAACNATQNQTYYRTGSGTIPALADVCYSDAGQTFLGNGFYKVSSTEYIQITGGSGVISSVSSFSLGTSFTSSANQTNATNACAASINQTYYHNGTAGQPPAATDTCYTDACKTTVLGNGYYKIATTGNGVYMQITGGSGVVSAVTNCPSGLTSYSSSVKGVFNQACPFNGSNPGLTETYYHNGGGSSGTPPSSGDTCYSDTAGTTVLLAGYYNLDSNTGVDNRSYIEIGASGVVSFGYPQTC